MRPIEYFLKSKTTSHLSFEDKSVFCTAAVAAELEDVTVNIIFANFFKVKNVSYGYYSFKLLCQVMLQLKTVKWNLQQFCSSPSKTGVHCPSGKI